MAGDNRRLKYQVTLEDKTKAGLNSIKRSVGGIDDKLGQLRAGFGAFLGAAGLGAAVSAVNELTNELDELGKEASSIGLASEELDAWRFAAERAGIDADKLGDGLRTVAARAFESARGTGEAIEALAELGIEATDSQGRVRGVTDLILEVGDAIQGIDRGSRVGLLEQIFGESGAQWANVLADGSAGIRELLVEANALGARTDQLTESAADYADQQIILERSTRAIGDTIAGYTLPILADMTKGIADAIDGTKILSRDFRDFIGTLRTLPAETALAKIEQEEKALNEQLFRAVTANTALNAQLRDRRDEVEYGLRSVGEQSGAERELTSSITNNVQAMDRYKAQLAALGEERRRIQARLELQREAEERYNETVRNGVDIVREREQLESQAAAFRQKALTAQERLVLEGQKVLELSEAGLLTEKERRRNLERINDQLQKANSRYPVFLGLTREGARMLDKTGDAGETAGEQIEQSMRDAGEGIVNYLATAASRGESILEGLGDYAITVAAQIAQALSSALFVQPFTEAIASALPGAGGEAAAAGATAAGGATNNVNFTINALDTQGAVEVIEANREQIVGVVQQAFNRSGRPGPLG